MRRAPAQTLLTLSAFAATLAAQPAAAGECLTEPPTVRYRGGTFTISFCASQAADLCEKRTCWAGLTLRRAKDGFQYDLPAKAVNGEDLRRPIEISAEVGSGYVEYAAAVWLDKRDCKKEKVKRHGCREYGYLLEGGQEGSDAAYFFPEWDFWGIAHPFAKIAPAKIQVLDAGGGAQALAKARSALAGVGPEVTHGPAAKNRRDQIEVLYRSAWERAEAWRLAKTLKDAGVGVGWHVKHWPGAPEDFVVAVGAPDAKP